MSKKRKTSEISEVVFEYTGTEGEGDVPKDVTIVRFHPSVTEVDDHLFKNCEQLKEVVLNEGGCKRLETLPFGCVNHCRESTYHLLLPRLASKHFAGAVGWKQFY